MNNCTRFFFCSSIAFLIVNFVSKQIKTIRGEVTNLFYNFFLFYRDLTKLQFAIKKLVHAKFLDIDS